MDGIRIGLAVKKDISNANFPEQTIDEISSISSSVTGSCFGGIVGAKIGTVFGSKLVIFKIIF